jgi:Tfp pilus tip-associated adhesin PilY1
MKHNKFTKIFIYINLMIIFFCGAALLQAQEENLFLKEYSPDALIVLDLSGSMNWNPVGGTNLYGNTECSGGTFYRYSTSQPGYTTVCSRVEIAKKVIFSVMDDTGNNAINNADMSAMNVRLGYMRYKNCSASSLESNAPYYSSTTECSADPINCSGANCADGFCTVAITGSGTRYASTDCETPDVKNCRGADCVGGFCATAKSTAVTYYSNSDCDTPSTYHCSGDFPTYGCSDGFCNSSYTGPTRYASTTGCTPDTINCRGTGCSGGFCYSSPITTGTYYAHDSSCEPNNYHCGYWLWSDCSGGFCDSPHSSWTGRTCRTACTRSCTVDCTPSCATECTASTTCEESCTSPGCANLCPAGGGSSISNGCNTLVWDLGKPYSCIQGKHETEWLTVSGNCETDNSVECFKKTGDSGACDTCVSNESATGGTHLAASLLEAKAYLDVHKAADVDRECREKFVILITDGADTLACGGSGQETQSDQYKRRRESVAMTRALANAGYKVFVIGFGANMPGHLKNTLNWMAYYGNSDNPNEANSGDVAAYNIPENSVYPSGITYCKTESDIDDDDGMWYAEANDPGAHSGITDTDITKYPLSGYAFFADDITSLTDAIKSALLIIEESTQSFSQASVQLSRTEDENYLYEASFSPSLNDPFWQGQLKKFSICTAADVSAPTPPAGCVKVGDIKDNYDLEAGAVLKGTDEALRTIKTYINGSIVNFDTGIDPIYFGYFSSNTAARNDVVGYIRGNATYNADKDVSNNVYKLGDVFRSNPITVGTPAQFFNDSRDQYDPALSCNVSNPKTKTAFASYRDSHCRAAGCTLVADRTKRLIVAGANDGQLHAFKTSDMTEAWSFIPPNLLAKLNMITHKTHPTTLSHQYFVDGQISVTDAWLPSSAGDGTCKSAADWKTLLILGEGRGTNPNVWSASPYCDIDFSTTYHSTNSPYYCGYHALDITNTLSDPVYKWSIKGSGGAAIGTSHGPYFGDAWSKMQTGRVRYEVSGSEVEKWVGFIGAGYNEANCSGTTCGVNCDCRGKGFFVIDLSNGRILWSFSVGSTASATKNPNMKYSLPATPALVDMDNDGFIDTAYIGDLGGNMWRFKFCKRSDTECDISDWSGARIFDGITNIDPVRPIYFMPSVATDDYDNVWILWGTGDKNDSMKIPPAASAYSEKIFALKDGKLNETSPTSYTINNLLDVTDTSTIYCNEFGIGCLTVSTENGWYMDLDDRGEKVLADSLVFNGRVYFTTYMPEAVTGGACLATGESFMKVLYFTSGAGALSGGARSMSLGAGIASSPIVSILGGNANMYVTTSSDGTKEVGITTPTLSNPTNVLFWRDHRVD